LQLSRFFPYDSPYYLFPKNDLLLNSLVYDELIDDSTTPVNSQAVHQPFNLSSYNDDESSEQAGNKLSQPDTTTVHENEESKMTFGARNQNSEIDMLTSGQDDCTP
jgi:hypothetical protein